MNSPAPDPPPAAQPVVERVAPPPEDLGSHSRRIARRTTDLIAIALIIGAGLTVASRVVEWWRTDPADVMDNGRPDISLGALVPWGIAPDGVQLQFGEAPFALRQQAMRGTFDDALTRLEENCVRRLIAAPAAALPGAASAAEQRLLTQLANLTPTRTAADNQWAVYRVPGPLAMVVGVLHSSPELPESRIAQWGIVLPATEGAWTVLTIEPRQTPAPPVPQSRPPLPPGATPGVALSDELGGEFATFSGGSPVEWRSHFDTLATEHGWRPARAWRTDPTDWSSAWIAGKDRGSARRIDVYFQRTETGWVGLLNQSPANGTSPDPR